LQRRSPGVGQESVVSMRAKTSTVLLTSAMELLSHTTMGAAVGLAVAFVLTRFDPLGLMARINHDAALGITPSVLVGIIVMSFTIGATLTGLVFMVSEDRRP
jgi:hypothetical protein